MIEWTIEWMKLGLAGGAICLLAALVVALFKGEK